MDLHKGVSPRGVKKRQLALTLSRETSNNLILALFHTETTTMKCTKLKQWGAGPPGARQSCTESSEDKIWKIRNIKAVTKNSTIQSYT